MIDAQALRDLLARDLRLWRRAWAAHPDGCVRHRRGVIHGLLALARDHAPPHRALRIALARAVRDAAMADPAHYATARRLADQIRLARRDD